MTMLLALLALSALAGAPVDIATARESLSGKWQGQLEYLDYSANRWFGIPVSISIEAQGDGATTLRRADFDDGPTTGNVRITTVELFDAKESSVAVGSFRKGRQAELMRYAVRLVGPAKDVSHWTMIEETRGTDDNRPATLRLTTTRDGDSVVTLKEVDFLDDAKTEWMTRNRTRLMRVAG